MEPDSEQESQRDRVERTRIFTERERTLTEEEVQIIESHGKQEVSDMQKRRLRGEVQRNWDVFYKRNGDRFFKDRHWHVHELDWLLDPLRQLRDANKAKSNEIHESEAAKSSEVKLETVTIIEVGCGTGNFLLPLLDTCVAESVADYVRAFACDFSPRAVELLRESAQAQKHRVGAFVADLTAPTFNEQADQLHLTETCDLLSLIFVLSAIAPEKQIDALRNAARCLKPGGCLLFRDYGTMDFAMFKLNARRSRLGERFYGRTDGTLCYYFQLEEIRALCDAAGLAYQEPLPSETPLAQFALQAPCALTYLETQTINVKEGICLPRVFVHGVFRKK